MKRGKESKTAALFATKYTCWASNWPRLPLGCWWIRAVTFSTGGPVCFVSMRCTLLSTSPQMSASKPPESRLWCATLDFLFTREIRCLPHAFLQHRILCGASWDALTFDLTFLYLYSDEPPSFYLPHDTWCNLFWRVCNYLGHICTML